MIAAHGGDAAFVDGFFPAGDVAVVLGVGVLDAADGGDAHAVEVGAGFGGVALEIAVERAILLGDGEFIAGLGEVVHADVEIAGFEKFQEAGAEDFKFLHALGEMARERALLLFEPGDVGVAEESDAVGSEFEDLLDGVGEGFGGLVGEAVDEIDVDAIEAEDASGLDQAGGEFEGLDAVDGFLDERMKILDAHTEAVETELAKNFEMFAAGDAGIDFDADFSVGSESEMFASEAEEVFDLRGRQVSGSAAAPMELSDGTLAGDVAADASHFALQDFEVRRCDALIFLDDDVAGAEEAQALAKGDVHVERNGGFGAVGFFMDFFEVGGAEGIVPNRRGGIAGVAGAGTVVAPEKLFADAKLFAHVLQAWIRDRHDKSPLTQTGCRFGFLQQRLPASFDKELGIFDGSVLQNSVAEIQNVAGPAKRGHGFLRGTANFVRRAVEHSGVDISLQGDAWSELFAQSVHVHAPIDAQNICAGAGHGRQKMVRGLG